MAARRARAEAAKLLKESEKSMEQFDAVWEELHTEVVPSRVEKLEAQLKWELRKVWKNRAAMIKALENDAVHLHHDDLNAAKKEADHRNEQMLQYYAARKQIGKGGRVAVVEDDEDVDDDEVDRRLGEAEDVKEAKGFVHACVLKLGEQIDGMEAEVEEEEVGGGDEETVEDLKAQIALHTFHISKLEQVTTLLENGGLHPEDVDMIRDDIEAYCESYQEPDHVPDMELYDCLHLERRLGLLERREKEKEIEEEGGGGGVGGGGEGEGDGGDVGEGKGGKKKEKKKKKDKKKRKDKKKKEGGGGGGGGGGGEDGKDISAAASPSSSRTTTPEKEGGEVEEEEEEEEEEEGGEGGEVVTDSPGATPEKVEDGGDGAEEDWFWGAKPDVEPSPTKMKEKDPSLLEEPSPPSPQAPASPPSSSPSLSPSVSPPQPDARGGGVVEAVSAPRDVSVSPPKELAGGKDVGGEWEDGEETSGYERMVVESGGGGEGGGEGGAGGGGGGVRERRRADVVVEKCSIGRDSTKINVDILPLYLDNLDHAAFLANVKKRTAQICARVQDSFEPKPYISVIYLIPGVTMMEPERFIRKKLGRDSEVSLARRRVMDLVHRVFGPDSTKEKATKDGGQRFELKRESATHGGREMCGALLYMAKGARPFAALQSILQHAVNLTEYFEAFPIGTPPGNLLQWPQAFIPEE